MRIKFTALTILLLCGAFSNCRLSKLTHSESKSDPTPVLVEINGSPEHQSAFDRFMKARLSDFAGQNTQSQGEIDLQKSQLLDEFIRRQLIVQEALKKNIEPTDDEIRRALEVQHKQTSAANAAGTSVNSSANESGSGAMGNQQSSDDNMVTLESSERRVEIFNDLLTLKYYQTEVLKNVKVTPQEVEAFYNSNKDRYQGKNGFYVREIRVHEESEAKKLYQQALAKPDDFAVLAKEHSEVPMASSGGLIYYEAQQLPPVLEQAITPLKLKTISRVIRSNYGFHIFKLEQRAEPLPLEKVRREIEDKLLSEKNQTLIDEFNKRVLSTAKINIHRDRLGFNYIGNITGS
jgi:parvulin-like peptidyl-prolyl isomerase